MSESDIVRAECPQELPIHEGDAEQRCISILLGCSLEDDPRIYNARALAICVLIIEVCVARKQPILHFRNTWACLNAMY